jgi:two-component system, OmpR family, sensor histidine kinase KdpD
MRLNLKQQYLFSLFFVVILTLTCILFQYYLNYKSVAFILLLGVSIVAMVCEIIPVLITATFSAVVWDYFFIEPRYTFSVGSTEDRYLLILFFIIALVNAVLSQRIKKYEKQMRDKEDEQRVIQLYNTLFNSLSHELKTPIATILGATDSLRDKSLEISTENKELLMDEISKASLRLNNQVENLLNISLLESGVLKLKLEWIQIEDVIYSVLNKLEIQNETHKIEVLIPVNLPLYKLDKGLIEQVLHNLVVNAISYTPDYSEIIISIQNEHIVLDSHSEKAKAKLVLSVTDNGNGLTENALPLIFDKFYRVESNKSGGSGLGLSIVKGFVEAHNGNVKVYNVKPNGACFVVDITCETSYLNRLKNE